MKENQRYGHLAGTQRQAPIYKLYSRELVRISQGFQFKLSEQKVKKR